MDAKFDPNFSISDKKYVPVFFGPKEPIDTEPLTGEQFWPKQKKSKNKLKKAISKVFKSIKRKIFHKSNKVRDADVKETIASTGVAHDTPSIDESTNEIDE